MGRRELERDLNRAYAKEKKLGDKLANASGQLEDAERAGHGRAAARYRRDVDYLEGLYKDAIADARQIREALQNSRY